MMRYLFCSLASHGFVYPAIGVALELRRRNHHVAFVTGPAFAETLHNYDIERIPRSINDGPSFQVEQWGTPLAIAIQVKHIEYALEHFVPDVLVGHQLTLGPLIVGERHNLPVAILGFATYLWPRQLLERSVQSAGEEREAWRYGDMLKHYNAARALFHLPTCDAPPEENPLLGDLFMLQSVPAFTDDADDLPARVHLVGSCLWEPAQVDAELTRWLDQAVASREPLIYVQHGRFFGTPSFWPHLVAALADKPIRVVAAVGRMDSDTGPIPGNFFIRPHVPQGMVLPYARAVIATGNTTAVLGALTQGLPSLLIPAGGEQEDVAENCQRAGVSLCIDPREVTPDRIADLVHDLLERSDLRQRAQMLQKEFQQLDGFERAADLLERLAATRRPVLRGQVERFQMA